MAGSFLLTIGMLEEADDHLLIILEKVNGISIDGLIALCLKEIKRVVDELCLPYSAPLLRSLILMSVLNRVFRYARHTIGYDYPRHNQFMGKFPQLRKLSNTIPSSIARDSDLPEEIRELTDLNRRIHQTRDHHIDHDIARHCTLLHMDSLEAYLKGVQLILDCLGTECYIKQSTRQKIYEELLVPYLPN